MSYIFALVFSFGIIIENQQKKNSEEPNIHSLKRTDLYDAFFLYSGHFSAVTFAMETARKRRIDIFIWYVLARDSEIPIEKHCDTNANEKIRL